MKTLRVLWSRIRGFVHRGRRGREFEEELATHVEMEVERNVRAGMDAVEARRRAILTLGGLESTRQAYRERSSLPFLENLEQDIRFAFRQFRKNRAFSFTALTVLSIGIAATAAIFAFVDAVLVRPLPYRDPDRLMWITERTRDFPRANLSYQDFLDWKSRNTVLTSFDAWTGSGMLLDGPSGPEAVFGVQATPGIFRTLGVQPVLGRDMRDSDGDDGATPVVILSYAFWQQRYGGDPKIIGRTLKTSDKIYTVIGVLPASFQFAPRGSADVWMVLDHTQGCMTRRSCHGLYGIGRLKEGVTAKAALAEFSTIASQLEAAYPDTNRGQGAMVSPLAREIQGNVRPLLLLLLCGAGLLFVIACVNVSSLLLVRFESRRREVAVRRALGASHSRLLRQFLCEGILLVSCGCVVGLGLAQLAIQSLLRLPSKQMLQSLPALRGLRLNLHVVEFAMAVGILATLVFMLAPALRLRLGDGIREDLAEGGRTGSSLTWRRFASHLVVVELAMAMVLLASAGLLGKSLYRLLRVPIGFTPDHLAMVDMVLPEAVAPKPPDQVRILRQVLRRAAEVPGVIAASATSVSPVNYNGNTTWFRIVGRPYSGEHNEVLQRDVSAEYFTMLQARLASGRFFADQEDDTKPQVVIINQTLARKYFPGEDPIGKRIGDTALSEKSLAEIVGVIEDVREGPLDSEVWPAIYYPFNQSPDHFVTVIARSRQKEESVIAALEKAIRAEDPRIGTFNERTMRSEIDSSTSAYLHRSSAWLVGGFAAIALLLGVVGLYGVIAYSVSQRTREIGVRMALGAQRWSVYQMVLREAGWLTAIGVGAGLGGAIAAATLMRSFLFEVRAWDAATLAGVTAVLAAAAIVASYLPARRAAAVNPVDALRAE